MTTSCNMTMIALPSIQHLPLEQNTIVIKIKHIFKNINSTLPMQAPSVFEFINDIILVSLTIYYLNIVNPIPPPISINILIL